MANKGTKCSNCQSVTSRPKCAPKKSFRHWYLDHGLSIEDVKALSDKRYKKLHNAYIRSREYVN